MEISNNQAVSKTIGSFSSNRQQGPIAEDNILKAHWMCKAVAGVCIEPLLMGSHVFCKRIYSAGYEKEKCKHQPRHKPIDLKSYLKTMVVKWVTFHGMCLKLVVYSQKFCATLHWFIRKMGTIYLKIQLYHVWAYTQSTLHLTTRTFFTFMFCEKIPNAWKMLF